MNSENMFKMKKKKKKKKKNWVKIQLYNSFTYYISCEKISETGDWKKGKIICKKVFWKKFRKGACTLVVAIGTVVVEK